MGNCVQNRESLKHVITREPKGKENRSLKSKETMAEPPTSYTSIEDVLNRIKKEREQ